MHIQFAELPVFNQDRAIAFYRKLGFAPVISDDLPSGGLTLARRF